MSNVTRLGGASFPTREQAAAAATHQLGEVGDEVFLHEATCFDADACVCTPVVLILTDEGWRYRS